MILWVAGQLLSWLLARSCSCIQLEGQLGWEIQDGLPLWLVVGIECCLSAGRPQFSMWLLILQERRQVSLHGNLRATLSHGKWKADAARSFEAFLTPFCSFRTHLLSLLAYSICQQVARQTQIPGGRDIDFTSGWQQWQCPIAKEFMAIKWFITVATVLGAFNSFKPRNHLVP